VFQAGLTLRQATNSVNVIREKLAKGDGACRNRAELHPEWVGALPCASDFSALPKVSENWAVPATPDAMALVARWTYDLKIESEKMPENQDGRSYLDIDELIVRTGLSRATIWRLKRDGKIPFYQPGGKGGRVVFPEDAIECASRCKTSDSSRDNDEHISSERLPGPRPKWMFTFSPKQ
jgi:predicted DNA-binding transcriptional regulator AlpA